MCLTFQLPLADHTAISNNVQFASRTWSAFDAVAFEQELADSDDVDWLFNEFNTHLTKLLDKHAPVRQVHRKPRRLALWFDGDCHVAKKTMRHLEQAYWQTALQKALALSTLVKVQILDHFLTQVKVYLSKSKKSKSTQCCNYWHQYFEMFQNTQSITTESWTAKIMPTQITSTNDLQSRVPCRIKRPVMTDCCGDLRPPRQLHHSIHSTSSDLDYLWCWPPVVSLYCGPVAHIGFVQCSHVRAIKSVTLRQSLAAVQRRIDTMHALTGVAAWVHDSSHQQPCSMTVSTRPALMAILSKL